MTNKMRLYKFRGFNGERWLYGNLHNGLEFTKEPESWLDNTVTIQPFTQEEWCVDGVMQSIPYFVVRPESVGEFTGELDATGTEIYEGDIIQDYKGTQLCVMWYGSEFVAQERKNDQQPHYHFNLSRLLLASRTANKDWKVVANIFQNPELK